MLITDNGNNYFALKKEDKTKNNSNIVTQESEVKVKPNDEYVDLLEKVKEYIKDKETISISRIQGEFGVGYPRATKIMKQLIEENLVIQTEEFRYIVAQNKKTT